METLGNPYDLSNDEAQKKRRHVPVPLSVIGRPPWQNCIALPAYVIFALKHPKVTVSYTKNIYTNTFDQTFKVGSERVVIPNSLCDSLESRLLIRTFKIHNCVIIKRTPR